MVIFFGTRAKVSTQGPLNRTCDKCGSGTVNAFSVFRYFHIFWIPVFPYKRESATECPHCHNVLIGRELPDMYKHAIRQGKLAARPPAYMFAGLFLIALLILGGYNARRVESARTADYASSPMVSDLYVVDLQHTFDLAAGDYQYGVIRVASISPDSIRFDVSSYGYKFMSDASSALRKGVAEEPDYFMDGEVAFSRMQVLAMHRTDQVKKIIRP